MKAVVQVAYIINILRGVLASLLQGHQSFYIQINGERGRINSVYRITRSGDGHDFAVLWDRNNADAGGE